MHPTMSLHRLLPLVVALIAGAPAVALACLCASPACGAILEAGTLFEGTVASVAPAGVEGVVVRFSDVRAVRGAAPTFVTTAPDGGACGYDFTVGRRYLIDARARPSGGYSVSLCSKTMPLEAAGGVLALLAAPPDARPRIFGRIGTRTARGAGRADGAGVGGAVVRLTGPVERSITTNANGEFSFTGVPDGDYRIDATTPGERRDVLAPPTTRVTLGGSDVCAAVDLVAPSTAQVSGTVVDVAGAPVASVCGWNSTHGRTTSGPGGVSPVQRPMPADATPSTAFHPAATRAGSGSRFRASATRSRRRGFAGRMGTRSSPSPLALRS